ncbi:fatty acyl-CoA reductase wat-like [Schistocerca cancellata]|uniref:fatty acyl-CoA reductase wat-like n=1 Tax=Schistocerca cancellata TaxID=274614 RepID=UPI002118DC3F|nr:fatty acyl-CoA reductase wat-like [Schistocerca cancellata]
MYVSAEEGQTQPELQSEPQPLEQAQAEEARGLQSPVAEFFGGASVLVTGGTGFLGKVLVEKLLRSCPRLRTIYLLVRTKKGRAPQQRLDHLFSQQVFSQLRPSVLKKVVAVAGDAGLADLGLSAADRAELCRHVSVVFHAAATVRFDEQLELAAAINVRGTHEVMRLARDMPNLKAVVHVSTAYSQCRERLVEERVYEAPLAPSQLLHVADMADGDGKAPDNKCDADISGDALPLGYPNTYTLTKAVAEQLVRDEGFGLPVAIVRPSMVVATSQEPVIGWIDNVYGPTGVCVAATLGLLHVMPCDKHTIAHIVPCDLVVNCVIAAAWDVATNRSPDSKEPKVFNLVSGDAPLRWENFMALYQHFGKKVPPMSAVWNYSMCLTTSAPLVFFYKYVVHMVPAVLADAVLFLTTGKPKMVGAYRKIHRLLDVTSYFCTREWSFDNRRCKALWSRLSPVDRQLFPFDMRDFDWDTYFYRYVRGVRLYILKEDMANVNEALPRWHRLRRVDRAIRAVATALLLWLLWRLLAALFWQ